MAAGHRGQILVVASTASLLDGVSLADLGEHGMAGISRLVRVYQCGPKGCGPDFRPQ
jgi:hypothetical protein